MKLGVVAAALVGIAAATWVWWNATTTHVPVVVVGPGTSTPKIFKAPQLVEYESRTFSCQGATRASYRDFIRALRDLLASGELSQEITLLRRPGTVPNDRRFILVNIEDLDGDSVTVAIDVINVYFVAYRVGDVSYFFREAPDVPELFAGTRRSSLGFAANYGALEQLAQNRVNIDLGIVPLAEAVSILRQTESYTDFSELARATIIIIEMIPEAARFPHIQRRVRDSIDDNGQHRRFRPDPSVTTLANSWNPLSDEIQNSNQGIFNHIITLQGRNYDQLPVERVDQIRPYIALLLYDCNANNNNNRRRQQLDSIISPLTEEAAKTGAGDEVGVCIIPEPTMRIRGRDDLCVDIRNGNYNDGNPVELWPCHFDTAVNQLWTIKRDGTIRSNDKCLTTYGYSPGSYVMIYDCGAAVTDATRWEIWDNGTIINPISGLVLSAQEASSGTTLTLQTNAYEARQGWRPTNVKERIVTTIIGFKGLCLQANEAVVWVDECSFAPDLEARQSWSLYPDGSIRPDKKRDQCLTCSSDAGGSLVALDSCSSGSSAQRWQFKDDGAILNLNSGLVLDVKDSKPSLHEIIIWPATGNDNQMWHLL